MTLCWNCETEYDEYSFDACPVCGEFECDPYEDGLSDVEADAMTLASAGWGTDEDYGYYGEDE